MAKKRKPATGETVYVDRPWPTPESEAAMRRLMTMLEEKYRNRRDPGEKAFYTVEELMARWSVSRPTIYRWVAAGRLRPNRVGARLRFSAEAVRAYEESGGG